MKDILSNETLIQGEWLLNGNQVSASEACLRIEWLINNRLRRVAIRSDGWETLYEDPRDNRKWILYYPEAELHNGGPPSLRLATCNEIQSNYMRYK